MALEVPDQLHVHLQRYAADLKTIAKLHDAFVDEFFVDEGAIGRAKVPNQNAIGFKDKSGVVGGNGGVGQDDITIFGTTNQGHWFGKVELEPLELGVERLKRNFVIFDFGQIDSLGVGFIEDLTKGLWVGLIVVLELGKVVEEFIDSAREADPRRGRARLPFDFGIRPSEEQEEGVHPFGIGRFRVRRFAILEENAPLTLRRRVE